MVQKDLIGFQSVVFEESGEDKYKFHLELTGANLQGLSLLLVTLHLIEKEIMDSIESITPEYEIRGE